MGFFFLKKGGGMRYPPPLVINGDQMEDNSSDAKTIYLKIVALERTCNLENARQQLVWKLLESRSRYQQDIVSLRDRDCIYDIL